jgi:hypothetical protein
MKLKAVSAVIGLVCVAGIPSAAFAASGAGAIVLSFPIGARYNALGEAGVGLAQDISATWFNPGGLAFLPDWNARTDIQIMNSAIATGLADDMGMYALGAAFAGSGGGVLAGSFTYLDMGDQDAVDEDGNVTGTFSSNEFVVQMNYAFKLSPTLGLGFGAKYFRDNLAPNSVLQDQTGGSGWAYGFDVGLLKKFPGPRLNLGLAVMNVGPKDITHVDEDQADPMPRKAATGFSWLPFQSEFLGLLVAADYQVPLYKWNHNEYGFGFDTSQNEWGGGVEVNYDRSLFLRIGYKSASYGDINDMTYGFGVDLSKWANAAIRFDFASVPQAKGLESVTRFSLGYRF